MPMKRNHNQFTLMELLTTITIISLLMGMMLPAASKARASARQIQCLSNLHQLQLAFSQYADDWRGRLPPYVTNAPTNQHPGLNWTNWSHPYYQDTRLLLCPASSGKIPEASPEGFRNYDGSYAWNYDGTQGNRGPLHVYATKPADSYLLCDSGDPCIIYGANTWENLMEELDLDWDSQAEGANRHLSRANCAFIDGHSASRGLSEFLGAPCKANDAPWCISWKDGILEPGIIPFPNR